jgi:CRP/FNR family cyclic AMP-dependent transcriptional regulator
MKTRRRNIPKVKRRKEPKAARPRGPAAASLEKQLDQRTRELAATKKQLTEPRDAGAVQPDKGLVDQRASSELLSVISRPSGELEPAFETLLANVTRLCQGKFGILHLREGEGFRMAAVHGAPPAYVEYRKRQPVIGVREFPHLPLARVARTKAVQHLPDLTRDRAYVDRDPLMVTLVESCGARSLLCIPMLKEEDLIGAIVIYYGDPRPLDQDQIALAKNFASRAVTAIESAHRLKELWQELFAGARTIRLSADETLFSAGQEGDGCYRVDEGLLKAAVTDPGGDQRILAILGPGSVVGELSMIDGAPRSALVVALRDSKVSFVSRSAFENFGKKRPELYRYLTTLLANRLRDTNDSLAATSFLSIKGRFARALLRLAETFGREVGQGRIIIRQKVSQADLAAMAGVARENVSRVLHEWTSRSLVSRFAGYYYLEDLAQLRREAED